MHSITLFVLISVGIIWLQGLLVSYWDLLFVYPSTHLGTVSASKNVLIILLSSSVALFLVSGWFKNSWTPVRFFLKFWALTGVVSFAFMLAEPTKTFMDGFQFLKFMQKTSYLSSWGLLLMFLIGYFLLPFSWSQKFLVSVLCILHNLLTSLLITWLCLQIPPLWGKALYPLLCLFLGPLLHFAWFVGFYSWALTWRKL